MRNVVEMLCNCLSEADQECNAAEHHADYAEMMAMLSESCGCHETTPLHHVDHHVWQDVYYADGGCATW